MNVLELHDLRGGYGEADILRGISLTVAAGEILTIAGTNGAGKSTLAKAIVGLLPDVRGRIVAMGRDLLQIPAEGRARMGVSYVPQVENIFGSMTVSENLQIVRDTLDDPLPLDEVHALFPKLKERQRVRAEAFSGGERQQLAFARALMSRPKLIVLDEPTAALAPSKVEETFALVSRLALTGLGILMVEQRARQALKVSDRGCILDQGVIALEGAASELLDDPKAAELYLGQAN